MPYITSKVYSPQTKKGKEKKAKFQLGVADSKLGSVIQESCGIPCVCNEFVGELMRGVRAHTATFIKGLSDLDMRRAQLGLAHSYSRAKVPLLLGSKELLGLAISKGTQCMK